MKKMIWQMAAPLMVWGLLAESGAGDPGGNCCDLRPVSDGDKYGYINTTGSVCIPFQYEGAHSFSEGLARAYLDGRCGYIDRDAGTVIGHRFYHARDFHEGKAAVQVEQDGKWGYIDIRGELVIKPGFDWAGDFCEGLARVKDLEEYAYIGHRGEVAIPGRFELALDFSEGCAFAMARRDGVLVIGFIGRDGQFVGDMGTDLDYLGSLTEGLAQILRRGRTGYVNWRGEEVIALDFDRGHRFSEGLAPVEQQGRWGFIGHEGEFIIPLHFDGAHPFAGGLARVVVDGKDGFIDKAGRIVIEPQYENAYSFSNGLAQVMIDGTWGHYINRHGEVVWSVPVEPPDCTLESMP